MRRLAALALASALGAVILLAAGVAPAAAHNCAQPVQIPVGQPSTAAVGVTVERATVLDVEIAFPAGLQLRRIDPMAGWTATRSGPTVRFRGGPIAPYTCKYFSFGVIAPARGTFGIGVVQRTADGTVVARSTPDPKNATSRILDQFVYAGVRPPASGGSAGAPIGVIAGIALVAAGIALAGVLVLRNRRSRAGATDGGDQAGDQVGDGSEGPPPETGADLDPELRARLERFRARSPTRRPHR